MRPLLHTLGTSADVGHVSVFLDTPPQACRLSRATFPAALCSLFTTSEGDSCGGPPPEKATRRTDPGEHKRLSGIPSGRGGRRSIIVYSGDARALTTKPEGKQRFQLPRLLYFEPPKKSLSRPERNINGLVMAMCLWGGRLLEAFQGQSYPFFFSVPYDREGTRILKGI
jgi:hypothetical protein